MENIAMHDALCHVNTFPRKVDPVNDSASAPQNAGIMAYKVTLPIWPCLPTHSVSMHTLPTTDTAPFATANHPDS
jgi:hypothetical protein